MKKTSAFILCIVVLLASSFAAYARPHHGFHHHPAPVVHYSHPHYHYHSHGPSRGWYNGALVVGATLAGLELVSEIVSPQQTTVVEKTVQVPVVQQPQVVIQQPVVPAQPQVVYVQQPQPPVVATPTPVLAPRTVIEETWRVLPDGTRVKVSEKTIVQ